jgi:hypothetical protein
MVYNPELGRSAPIRSGPIPTDEELAALVHRGCWLQSEMLWRSVKQAFKTMHPQTSASSAQEPVPAPLLWNMLDRLNYDVPQIKQDAFKATIARMTKQCHACTNSYRCVRWLHDLGSRDDPQAFCPNSMDFASLPRAANLH